MCATFWSTDRVYKWHLLECAIWKRADHFPPIWRCLSYFRQLFSFLAFQVEINVVWERFNLNLRTVQHYPYFPVSDTSHIVNSLSKQSNDIVVKVLHFEQLKVWLEPDAGEVLAIILWTYYWFFLASHVLVEKLGVVLFKFFAGCFYLELCWEDVSKFSTEAVATASNFLFVVVVVRRGQKMS